MFLIHAHAKPNKNSDQYGKAIGAYVNFFTHYKDIGGAFELAKYYIKENGWDIDSIEEEYFEYNNKDEVDKDHIEYFDESFEMGFSLVFHCYDSED